MVASAHGTKGKLISRRFTERYLAPTLAHGEVFVTRFDARMGREGEDEDRDWPDDLKTFIEHPAAGDAE